MFNPASHLRMLPVVILLGLVLPVGAVASLAPANELGQFRYLIEFTDPGMLRAVDRQPGERLDADSDEALAYRAYLQDRHAAFLEEVSAGLARIPEVTHRYYITHSGMAAWLEPDEAEFVRGLDDVASVKRERLESINTYRGPTFIGADLIWDGSAVPDGTGTRGEGAVVAILDTGVDPDHPSFANDPSCGHGASDTRDKLISMVDCSITDLDGRCIGPLPNDTQSHGSHVASTAAGNFLDVSADPPVPEPYAEISGVAPCAHVRSYKVCPDLLCPGSMIQAGMDNVLLDGDVDVMNFSISGGRNPWNDNDRRKLDVVDGGVVVAASAGNTSDTVPDPIGAVNHLGPWVFTIAASTHDDGHVPKPHLSASGPGVLPENTQLLVLTDASADPEDPPPAEPFVDKPIRRAVDDALQIDDEGCAPFTPGYFEGAVALIQRGTCAFAIKVQNAQAAGADMVIIRNNEPGALTAFTVGATPLIPVYGMSLADGEAMAAFIGEHPDSTTVDFELFPAGVGDVLAGFSLRGPTPEPLENLTKPDITAPGVAIFAAEPTMFGLAGGYGFKSGTSMSSPHSAGAAALVRAVHRDWTPPEVKSAIMMTGFQGGTKPDETTPWDTDDVGSGRVDLTRAALSGLVMNEVFDNFLAANPAAGGDVRTLNIPAVRDMDCTPSCSWIRTVRNTLDVPSEWTASGNADDIAIDIDPASFSFGGDTSETREIAITATPQGDQSDTIVFGDVVFRESGGLSPDQHVTVAVSGTGDPEDPPTPEQEVDDADPAVEYRRGWHRVEDADATSGGYHRRMGSPNGVGGEAPTARLVFEGDGITYLYAVSEQGGSADVFIDGEFRMTIDYAGTAPGDSPEFGHSATFDELGEGTHEILVAYRFGAAYVDGFIIDTGEEDGGADASAAETRSTTTTSTAEISGLDSNLVVETVDVGSADEWLSVVVESSASATASLLDPAGTLLAEGEELLAGSGAIGIDVVPLVAGTYTVEVLGPVDEAATVNISIARTTTLD